jgi:hypothetical protein
MLLDLGHQQDFALLMLSDLKGIVTSDALALRMHRKGHAGTFCLHLILFEEIELRFPRGFKAVWILVL